MIGTRTAGFLMTLPVYCIGVAVCDDLGGVVVAISTILLANLMGFVEGLYRAREIMEDRDEWSPERREFNRQFHNN